MANTPRPGDQPDRATGPTASSSEKGLEHAELPSEPPYVDTRATPAMGTTIGDPSRTSAEPTMEMPTAITAASTADASTAADDEAAVGAATDARRSRRMRKRLVNVLAVLTCLATLSSVVAVWTHHTLFDTDAWMEIIGPLADDPAITDALGVALTDQLFEVANAQQLATEALPEQASFLAVPLTNAVRGYIEEAVQQLLQTDQFKQLWNRANRLTHDTAVELLRGNSVMGFTITDGTVTLNLLPLLARAMTFIDERAPRLFGDRPIPEISAETPVGQARAELSTALGRDLPEGFGAFTVLQSDQLASAQRAVLVLDRLVYVLIGLTLILLVATLVLSRNRRRTVAILGLGVALSMVIANAIVSALEDQVLGLITGEVPRKAVATTISSLISSLEVSTTTLAVLGLVAVVAAFLAGDSRTAVGVRRAVATGSGRARTTGAAVIGRQGSSVSVTPLPVVARNLSAFRVGGVIATMVWLIVIDITWVKLALVLVVLAVYQVAVTILGRAVVTGTSPTDAPLT